MIKWDLPHIARLFNLCNLINVIYHLSNVNDKKYMRYINTSIDTEKTFDKVQHCFMIKTLNKLGIGEMYLKVIKARITR